MDLPEPFAPVIATRSAQSIWRSTGPKREVAAPDHGAAQRGDHRAGARRGGDLHPQLPLLARLLDHVQPLDQPLGLPGLGGLLLAGSRRGPCGRSCRCRCALRRALRTPLSIQARCVRARACRPGPGVGVLLVLLAGVPAGDLPLLQVGRVAAAVGVDLLLGEVELDDPGDGAGQELAVVADHDGAGAQAGDELLQPLQAVEVEVVGRLVEQEDVVAAEQQRGEAGAGRLAAGQRRSSAGRGRRRGRGRAATASARSSRSAPPSASQRSSAIGVGVVGAGRAVDQRLGGGVQRGLRGGDAGAAGQERPRPSRPARRSGSCGR